MKKLINIIILTIISFSIFAQERTVSKDFRREGDTYYKYTGIAADTLIATNQDTIDYVFQTFQPNLVKKIDVKIRYDVVAGADTTVSAQLDGKEFSDQTTYTAIIAAAVGSAVAADNTVHIISSDYTESVASYQTTIASTVDTLINGTNTYDIDADVTQIAYVDTSTTDSLLTEWTVTPSLDTAYLTKAAQTLTMAAQTVTPADKSFRYYRLRLIIAGDDATGTGIKVDEIEIKLYTD